MPQKQEAEENYLKKVKMVQGCLLVTFVILQTLLFLFWHLFSGSWLALGLTIVTNYYIANRAIRQIVYPASAWVGTRQMEVRIMNMMAKDIFHLLRDFRASLLKSLSNEVTARQ